MPSVDAYNRLVGAVSPSQLRLPIPIPLIPVGAVSNCALSGPLKALFLTAPCPLIPVAAVPLSGAVGKESLSHQQKRRKTGLVSNSRGLVDLLVGDVNVKLPVEVVVFAVHLCSQVVDSRIYIRVNIAEALIHVGAKIVYPLIKTVYTLVKTVYTLVKTVYSIVHIAEARIHIGVKIVYTLIKIADSIVHIAEARIHIGVKIVYTLVKIADSIVHIAEARVHMGVKIDYPLVKIADSIVHIAESLVKIDESIVHITESLALYGYHVIKNSRESQNKTNKERYEFNVGHGGYSFRGYSGRRCFELRLSRAFILVGAVSNCAYPVLSFW